jgi:uncharacterized protein involved in outer membrane biogenesis
MLKKILIILVVLFIGFLVFRDLIIKQAAVSVGSSVLGAPLKIGHFSMSLLGSRLDIRDIQLLNPSGFSKNPLIDIAHIKVQYLPMDLIKGKMYFPLIDLNVRTLSIERNQEGQFNVSSLKVAPAGSGQKEAPAPKTSSSMDMRIDLLKLHVGKVIYREFSKNGQMKETDRGVGLEHREFRNITNPQKLTLLILFESSGIGALKDLASVATKGLLKEAGGLGKGVTQEAKDTVKSLVGSFKSVISK